jgi:hypothetical protein
MAGNITHRRWTAEDRANFLKALAETGTVRGAAAAIGRSVAGAHCVRQREPEFAEAWDHVLGRVRSAWDDARSAVVTVPKTGKLTGYRLRHDGWTEARQASFLRALSMTGCVRDACAQARISDTSAYRHRKRSTGFARAWDRALAKAMPTIEQEAYRRAVEGWDETVWRNGEPYTVKRRYSDSLLRLLLQRGDAAAGNGNASPAELVQRARDAARAAGGHFYTRATREETDAALLKKIEMIEKARKIDAENDREAARKAAGGVTIEHRPDAPGESGGGAAVPRLRQF